MKMNLTQEHVLVTGGAQGIGEAIVRDCAEKGAKVSFIDIDRAKSAELVAELSAAGQQVQFAFGDVSNFQSFSTAHLELVSKYGPVTAGVSNAGRNSYADPVEYEEKEWESFFALDLKSSWYLAKLCLPEMRKAKSGAIVNIASIHGRMTTPNFFPYSAAKHGIVGLSRSLALDEIRHGIRVNSVSPGYIATPLQKRYFEDFPEAKVNAIQVQPMKRVGLPSEVAKVVTFLLSSESTHIVGADLMVDGGLHSRYAS